MKHDISQEQTMDFNFLTHREASHPKDVEGHAFSHIHNIYKKGYKARWVFLAI